MNESMFVIPTLDPGLLWVEKRIRDLSQELGQPVDCLEWPQPFDASAKKIPLKLWRGGEFRREVRQTSILADVLHDSTILRGVRQRNGRK